MFNAISGYISDVFHGREIAVGDRKARWTKVKDLKIGDSIATLQNDAVEFDEVVEIRRVGREQVFDIEVEGSRNFVGNGILAHNTYLTGGNVGIGTTNPLRELEVNGSIRMGALITGAGTAVAVYRDVNGDLADSTSSIQYKTDLTNLENVLPKLMDLSAVRFKWGENTSTPGVSDFGMIAEEVNKILPDLVTYEADGVTPRGLKYEKMGLFAIKGLQEQQKVILDLARMTGDMTASLSAIPQIQDQIASLSAQMASVSARLAKAEPVIASDSEAISQMLEQIASSSATPRNDMNIATFSAEIGTFSDSLKVVGTTQLAATTIGGSLTVGLLHFDDMKAEISSLTGVVSILGDATVSGQLKAKTIETDGITLKDKTTGETYCVQIDQGEIVKKKGKCE